MHGFAMLWAVHIGDGILRPGWLVGGFLLAGLLYRIGARRICEEEIPRIALLTAVFFVASTLHVPVGPTTSIHLLYNGLVGVVLGWRSAVAIPVALLLQAMLLHHGGLYSLGVNSCVMVLPALESWLLFRGLHRLKCLRTAWGRALLIGLSSLIGILSAVYSVTLLATNMLLQVEDLDLSWANAVTFHPGTLLAATACSAGLAWLERFMKNTPEFPLGLVIGEQAVLATAALNFLVLFWGGETYFAASPLILLVAHLPLAVFEGVILGITVGFLMRVKPEMLIGAPSRSS